MGTLFGIRAVCELVVAIFGIFSKKSSSAAAIAERHHFSACFHDKGWHATIDEQHHFSACIHAMTWRAMLAFERHGDVSSEYDYIAAV